MPFVVKGIPISAPQTGPRQQSSKSFALRDQGHLVFTFTSMDSELKRWEARQQLILDVLESHVGPQREPAPDKPTRFGTICLNALGNSASNKSTQLRVALKQATRFFCRLVLKRFVFRETANEINIFCRNAFEWHKRTFANYLLNLSYCLIKVMCFSRLHLWKKKCCSQWELQTTNPFHIGAILTRFQTT